jgi:creatinine amidohydrolase
MTRRLDRLTWPQVEDLPERLLLVPVGSTEQHGPHLPAGTDTQVADAVAGAVAGLLPAGAGALIGPAIGYGASGEHEQFPGTVSIGHAALELVLVELGRSACRWAGRLLFVNGHGGNLPTLDRAVGLLRSEGRNAAWVGCGLPGADPHAGGFETALLLALDPSWVRTELAEPGVREPLARLLPRLRTEGVRAVSPNGVLGDPTGADAATGRALLDDLVGDVLARVLRWHPDDSGRLTAPP